MIPNVVYKINLRSHTRGARAPKWWGSFYCFSIKSYRSWLLHTGRATVNQVLHHLLVPIPAGEDQGCGSIGLGCNEFGHFFLGLVVKEELKIIDIKTSVYDR